MKVGQNFWSRDELILAFNLYCKTPFGKLHRGNPDVINLANLIGRTSGAVAYKLVNFASLDPALKVRGIKGASNAGKLDKEVWDEFCTNWEALAYQSELLLANYQQTNIQELHNISDIEILKEGQMRERMVRSRVNQAFFRSTVLASYNYCCCITGIQNPEFLIAGHIKPWSVDEKNRLNPSNGISINALHDKAFETGLLTITPEYKIRISSRLYRDAKKPNIQDLFLKYDQKEIILPSKFLPEPEFLEYHNNVKFII